MNVWRCLPRAGACGNDDASPARAYGNVGACSLWRLQGQAYRGGGGVCGTLISRGKFHVSN